MSRDKESWIWHRYYNVPPVKKTVADCAGHGADHRAYACCPQVDPRWTDEQKEAYWTAYDEYKEAKKGQGEWENTHFMRATKSRSEPARTCTT